MKVCTLNAQGTGGVAKCQMILNNTADCDIVLLQETHQKSQSNFSQFSNVWIQNYELFYSLAEPRNSKTGVITCIRRSFLHTKSSLVFEIQGRALGVVLHCISFSFLLVNVYVPVNRTERPTFLQSLCAKINNCDANFDYIVMGGDWNMVELFSDRLPQKVVPDRGTNEMNHIRQLFNLHDISEKKEKTFISAIHQSSARLDRIYMTNTILAKPKMEEVITFRCSDHAIVKFSILTNQPAKGKSYWKMNTEVLTYRDLQNKLDTAIRAHSNAIITKLGVSKLTQWQTLKEEIKYHCDCKARDLARRRKNEEKDANQAYKDAKEQQVAGNNSNELKDRLVQLEAQLEKINRRKIKETMHGTHYRDITIDNMSLATAKALHSKSAAQRYVEQLQDSSGNIITGNAAIIKEVRKQYNELFSKPQINAAMADHFVNQLSRTVNEETNAELQGHITEQEVIRAIKKQKPRKSPGIDGIPSEFYKKYSELLAPVLTNIYNTCFETGFLSSDMYKGTISMLYKGKGDKTDRKNWRPITMLNVDYKILATIITTRLKTLMPQVINEDQTCGVQGRSIHDGLLHLYNVTQLMADRKEGLLMAVDHESAFDLIDWTFITKCMRKVGINNTLIRWINTIYKPDHVNSVVLVNGYISRPFNMYRGIRQGCPISALLYVLIGETISEAIRTDEQIKGIRFFGEEYKVNCYADDTSFTILDEQDAQRILSKYRNFTKASGAKLKENKTKVILFDQHIQISERLAQCITNAINIYGVNVTSKGIHPNANTQALTEDLKQQANNVPPLELSLHAKLHLVNTYFLSKIWHKALVMSISKQVIDYAEIVLDKYLWFPARRNIIKKDILKLPKEEGGVGYPDIPLRVMAFRLVKHISRLNLQNTSRWHNIYDFHYDAVNGLSKAQLRQNNTPEYYKELRLAEIEFKVIYRNDEFIEILNKLYPIKTVTIAKLCKEFAVNKHSHTMLDKWIKWEPYQITTFNNWKAAFQTKLKFSNGYSRTIHFLFLHSSLETRQKACHYKQLPPSCGVCMEQGHHIIETEHHLLIECIEAQELWPYVEQLLNLAKPNTRLENQHKLLGFTNQQCDIANMLIIEAQRSIWQTRKAYERNSMKNIIAYYKFRLYTVLNRNRAIFGDTYFEAIFEPIVRMNENSRLLQLRV